MDVLKQLAREVVEDWDGADTADLLAAIVRATGEGEVVFHEARVRFLYPLEDNARG